MLISEILRTKGAEVHTVPPDTTVKDFLHLLAERNIGACVVSMDARTILGIVSERDVAMALARRGAVLLADPVSSIATVRVHTTAPDATLESVMRLMTEQRVRHVPVLVDGELAGIVSLGDIVARRLEELEVERGHLTDYILSAG